MLDGAPLNVFADGLGAIQVRVDGLAAGSVLRPRREPRARRPGDQGGRLRLSAAGRLRHRARPRDVEAPTIVDAGGGTRTLHSAYTVGPNLRVSEDYTYTDGDDADRRPLRHHERLRRADVAPRGRARRPLRRRQRQRQRRHLRTSRRASSAGATRPTGSSTACRRSRPGARSRRATSSSSSTTSRATASTTRSTRRRRTTASASTWQLDNIAPGETRGIDVRWLLAAAAPPGTIVAAARRTGQPDATASSTRRAACCRRRWPASPSTSSVRKRHASSTSRRAPRSSSSSRTRRRSRSGTIFDTLKGNVSLTSAADKKGGVQNAWFYSGIFKVGPDQGPKPITELSLAEPKLSCPKGKKASAVGQEEEDAQAVGRRQGQVPHHAATSARPPSAAPSGSSSIAATAR